MLAWSRWRFVAFAADEKAATTLGLLAEALHAAGGVPAKLLTDRMGCLKGGVVANVVVPTPEYVRFAAHYGFTPDFCHAQDPQSKGIVENLVGYAQRDLVVPLLTEAQLAGRPVGLDAANAAARRGAPRSTPASIPRSPRSRTSGWCWSGRCCGRCRLCGWTSARRR